MDPFSAISLAGNIVQFIDFASKIVSKGNQIRTNGATTDNLGLEEATANLLEIVSKLKQQVGLAPQSGCLTEDDQMLEDLTNNCIVVGRVLLGRLEELKVPATAKHRKWKSLRQGLKTVWDKKNLDAFAAKLADFRNQLEVGILLTLKNDTKVVQLQQSAQYAQLSRQSKDLLDALILNQDVFAEHIENQRIAVAKLHQNTVAQIIQHQESLPGKIADAFGKSILENTQSVEFEAYKEQVKNHNEQVDRAFLRRLKFPTMNDRYDRIADAHEKTFEWIFCDPITWNKPWSDFSSWLLQDEGIYWINGKAGSGKSTLMRYLVESEKTWELLKQWSGTGRLTVAAFFFWNGGAKEQASHTGLLRSLLHEILSKNREAYPDLIRLVFPDEWADAEDAVRPKGRRTVSKEQLSLRRLQKAFRCLARQDVGRICLFIDGLDEYDGDAMDTIQLFKQISSENIKVCLSSRPWVVFAQAFESQPKLRLQDLTFVDIKIYVNDNLYSNQRMIELRKSNPEQASQLVNDIVTKASGVFLWVMLVVRDLLKGLTYHDRIPALQRRIEALPSELRDLYNTMLGQIEPLYWQEGSRMLQMMSISRALAKEAGKNEQRCSAESLCAVGLSFVMEEENPLPEVELINILTPEEVSERVFEVDCRLRVCCSGLLEVSSLDQAYFKHDKTQNGVLLQAYGNTKIQYLHRTVQDFIESPEMQNELRRYTDGTRFDSYVSLLTSSVLRVRRCFSPHSIVEPMQIEDGVSRLGNIVEWCVMLAREHEMKAGRCEVELLNELEIATSLVWDQLMEGSAYKTVSSYILTEYGISDIRRRDDFLSMAAVYDLSLYLAARLGSEKRPLTSISCAPYLRHAIGSSPITSEDRVPCLKTIKVLVQHGACPTRPVFQSSPLEWVLNKVSHLEDKEVSALQWAPILDFLLRHRLDSTSSDYGQMEFDPRWSRQVIGDVYSKSLPEVANTLFEALDLQDREEKTQPPPAPDESHYPWLTRLASLILSW